MVSEKTKLASPVNERDHVKGPADAKITLVEYGDYECPDCGRAYSIVQEIQKRFAGRLRFVFRNFPKHEIHPNARAAAEAAEATAAQGKFWEMHELLFKNQRQLDFDHILEYAASLGLDMDRFTREWQNHVYEERVREDYQSGMRSGVAGTPTFFINDFKHNGSYSLEALSITIDNPDLIEV
ncbi:MAG: DsbA family protein [bacterium]